MRFSEYELQVADKSRSLEDYLALPGPWGLPHVIYVGEPNLDLPFHGFDETTMRQIEKDSARYCVCDDYVAFRGTPCGTPAIKQLRTLEGIKVVADMLRRIVRFEVAEQRLDSVDELEIHPVAERIKALQLEPDPRVWRRDFHGLWIDLQEHFGVEHGMPPEIAASIAAWVTHDALAVVKGGDNGRRSLTGDYGLLVRETANAVSRVPRCGVEASDAPRSVDKDA